MTIKLGICYCDSGSGMSKCVAGNLKESEHCDYFDDSTCGKRCMYFIMDEYCDCWQASDFYKQRGVITWDDWNKHMDRKHRQTEHRAKAIEEEEPVVSDYRVKGTAHPPRSCSNCRDFLCCLTDPSQYPEGTQQQLAVKCTSYYRA